MLKILTLALLSLSIVSLPSRADWGDVWTWEKENPEWYVLKRNGLQQGALRVEGRAYFALLPGDQWIQIACPCELPAPLSSPVSHDEKCPKVCGCGCHESGKCDCGAACACSCGCGKSGKCACGSDDTPRQAQVQNNYGVDSAKIHPGNHHINGVPCSREDIISAIKDVPHDQNRPRLTLIAPEPALSSLKAVLAQFSQEHGLVFQAYAPDNWAISGIGFKTDALPVVYLQQPDGRVLLRLDRFSGKTDGPLVETVRKQDPSYDPGKDPTGSGSLQSLLDALKKLPGEVWAFALVIFYAYSQKKGAKP